MITQLEDDLKTVPWKQTCPLWMLWTQWSIISLTPGWNSDFEEDEDEEEDEEVDEEEKGQISSICCCFCCTLSMAESLF